MYLMVTKPHLTRMLYVLGRQCLKCTVLYKHTYAHAHACTHAHIDVGINKRHCKSCRSSWSTNSGISHTLSLHFSKYPYYYYLTKRIHPGHDPYIHKLNQYSLSSCKISSTNVITWFKVKKLYSIITVRGNSSTPCNIWDVIQNALIKKYCEFLSIFTGIF
jgi:hypothetical protein